MTEYAKVVFSYRNVEVSIWVAHPRGANKEFIIEKAIDELTLIHDIDVRHLGEWKAEVE